MGEREREREAGEIDRGFLSFIGGKGKGKLFFFFFSFVFFIFDSFWGESLLTEKGYERREKIR